MTWEQEVGVVVLAAVGVRALWVVVPLILYARVEARETRLRADLNRFIKDDYQRDAQIARLRGLQKPEDTA